MKELTRQLQTNQLYPEESFIYYCTADEGSVSQKMGDRITRAFLEACERDNLIQPLCTQEQPQVTPQGTVTGLVKYYSPFHIFLVSALSKNIVDEEGLLRGDIGTPIDFQKQQNTRFMAWGDMMAFNVDLEKNGSAPLPGGVNHFLLAKYFNNFLKLLHSLNTIDPYEVFNRDTMRLNGRFPNVQYDLTPIRNNATLLAEYDLDLEKLKIILKHVGMHALHIDPNEEWYYYIQKHPQQQRDELKGMAAVAQDLYSFCTVVADIIGIISDEPLPPFLEFVHGDIMSPRTKRNHYVQGDDILAIKKAYARLVVWIEKNKTLLQRVALLPRNDELLNTLERSKNTAIALDDFHMRYGDVRYVSSYRFIAPSDKKLDELDPITRKHAETAIQYRSSRKDIDDDVDFSQAEITRAIIYRLGSLKMEVVQAAHTISQSLYPEEQRIQDEKTNAFSSIQTNYFSSNENEKEDESTRRTLFYKEALPREQKVYDDQIQSLWKLRAELGDIGHGAQIVLCSKCRKNPVIEHQQQSDGKISAEAICDTCVSETNDLQSIKGGEWHCEHANKDGHICNTLLYKFAYNNILKTNLQHTSPAKITLKYGRMEVEVSCPKCRKRSVKEIDWGWLP